MGLGERAPPTIFILGRCAAAILETRDAFYGILPASKDVRIEALAHFEAASFRNASGAFIAMVVENCHQLTTLNLAHCRALTALPESLCDCLALARMKVSFCPRLAARPKRIGDCAAISTLNMSNCDRLTTLPEQLGDCAALTALTLAQCFGITVLSERPGDCATLTTLRLPLCSRDIAL